MNNVKSDKRIVERYTNTLYLDKSENTANLYSWFLAQYELFCTQNSLNLLDRNSVIEYISSRSNLSSSTKQTTISILKQFFKHNNIDLKLSSPKKDFKLPVTYEQKYILGKLQALELQKEKSYSKRFAYTLSLLLYATGVRISDALELKISDLQEDAVHIFNQKSQQEAVYPLPPKILKELRVLAEYNLHLRTNGHIFVSAITGKKIIREVASVYIHRAFGFYPHTFRHCFATHMLENGCDIFTIKEFLGHSSVTTTQIYTKIQREKLRKTVNANHPMQQKKREVTLPGLKSEKTTLDWKQTLKESREIKPPFGASKIVEKFYTAIKAELEKKTSWKDTTRALQNYTSIELKTTTMQTVYHKFKRTKSANYTSVHTSLEDASKSQNQNKKVFSAYDMQMGELKKIVLVNAKLIEKERAKKTTWFDIARKIEKSNNTKIVATSLRSAYYKYYLKKKKKT